MTPDPSPRAPTPAPPVTACPLCGGRALRFRWQLARPHQTPPRTFRVAACADCGLAVTSPQPSDEELVQYYDRAFYGAGAFTSSLSERVYRQSFDARRSQIERYQTGPGSLLDVGCGDGRFVRYYANRGWDAVGFDFSPSAQAMAHQTNPNVRILGGHLHDHHLPAASFDVITLWQVLEHIRDPVSLLRSLRQLLKPGGLLVAAVPNIESFQSRLAGSRWFGLDVPRHLTHFSPRTLRRTLETAGLRVHRINHFSFRYAPYGMFYSLLDRLFTRHDFMSDLAKRTLPADLGPAELVYNLAVLAVGSPIAAGLAVLDTFLSPLVARGGFIEIYATRPSDAP